MGNFSQITSTDVLVYQLTGAASVKSFCETHTPKHIILLITLSRLILLFYVCVCVWGVIMHNSTGIWERELTVRMEVCTKSWGSRWDCWYGQDITGSVGWASSSINKCKCWLSARRRSRHHTAGPALTTCAGAESIGCFLEDVRQEVIKRESCWLEDLKKGTFV